MPVEFYYLIIGLAVAGLGGLVAFIGTRGRTKAPRRPHGPVITPTPDQVDTPASTDETDESAGEQTPTLERPEPAASRLVQAENAETG